MKGRRWLVDIGLSRITKLSQNSPPQQENKVHQLPKERAGKQEEYASDDDDFAIPRGTEFIKLLLPNGPLPLHGFNRAAQLSSHRVLQGTRIRASGLDNMPCDSGEVGVRI